MVSAYCLGCGGIDTVPSNTNTKEHWKRRQGQEGETLRISSVLTFQVLNFRDCHFTEARWEDTCLLTTATIFGFVLDLVPELFLNQKYQEVWGRTSSFIQNMSGSGMFVFLDRLLGLW